MYTHTFVETTTTISCGDTMLFKAAITTTTIKKMKCPKQQLHTNLHMYTVNVYEYVNTENTRLYSYNSKNNKIKN